MLGKKGFTLIEVLVVIAIAGILASIALVNMGKNPDRDVRLEADRFSAFLRDVQNRALAMEKISDATGKVCGFGIHKNADDEIWVYYVETTGSDKLNTSCADASISKNYPGGTNDPYKLETFNFRNEVSIGTGSLNDDLFFLSPSSKVYYGNSDTFASPINVDLTKTGLGIPIPIKIDQSGRIY